MQVEKHRTTNLETFSIWNIGKLESIKLLLTNKEIGHNDKLGDHHQPLQLDFSICSKSKVVRRY